MLRCSGSLPLRATACHENSFFINKKASANAEAFKFQAPRAGFEPATNRLTVDRSTAELPRNGFPENLPARPPGSQVLEQLVTSAPGADTASAHLRSSVSA